LTARTIIHVPIGEMRVSTASKNILFTCVGSCCAVALYDGDNNIAGMVHTVLPGKRQIARAGDRHAFYADTGIPLLISEMEQQGAVCEKMIATVVGGACLSADGKSFIGSRNIEQALSLLEKAAIPVTREETGGEQGRVIEIDVDNGSVKIWQTPVNKLQMPSESVETLLSEADLNSLSKDISRLQPDPKAARELFDAIHQKNIEWEQVERILFQDIVLALQIFQMCNSEYYGIPSQIDAFDTALSKLGPDRFRRICVVAAAGRNNDTLLANKGFDQNALSRHSLTSAICARHIAKKLYPHMQEQAFIAAFFHPLGCILAQMISKGVTADPHSPQDDCVSSQKNDFKIAGHHMNLARDLLRKWNSPKLITDAISSVAQPPSWENDKINLAAIVNASCCISSMVGVTISTEKINFEFSLYALEQTKNICVDDQLLSEIILMLRAKELLPV